MSGSGDPKVELCGGGDSDEDEEGEEEKQEEETVDERAEIASKAPSSAIIFPLGASTLKYLGWLAVLIASLNCWTFTIWATTPIAINTITIYSTVILLLVFFIYWSSDFKQLV